MVYGLTWLLVLLVQMLMKGSKDCIGNSYGLESASTTVDHYARPNSKELHWNGLVVVDSMQ